MGRNNQRGRYSYESMSRQNRNYMYKNFEKSRSYNTNFSNSNFSYVSFRGASMKYCSFENCLFKGTEFIGSNLKGSNFSNSTFEDVIFNSAILERANFDKCKFINVKFLCVDYKKARKLFIEDSDIVVLTELPVLSISEELNDVLTLLKSNPFIKRSRVLHLKCDKINTLNIKELLAMFEEETLIERLQRANVEISSTFYTFSYLKKFLEKN